MHRQHLHHQSRRSPQNNAPLVLLFCLHVWLHDCSMNINIYSREEREQIYKGTKSNYLPLGRVWDVAFWTHADEVIEGGGDVGPQPSLRLDRNKSSPRVQVASTLLSVY